MKAIVLWFGLFLACSALSRADQVVTTANDSGPGSLRQAVANALADPGNATITFVPGMSGLTITRSSEIYVGASAHEIYINAFGLPARPTLKTAPGNAFYGWKKAVRWRSAASTFPARRSLIMPWAVPFTPGATWTW